MLSKTNRAVSNNELARLLAVTKGEASKRVSAAIAAGFVQRRRIGRKVAITLH
jgi:DNA-binding MarR family transcriptional regulator